MLFKTTILLFNSVSFVLAGKKQMKGFFYKECLSVYEEHQSSKVDSYDILFTNGGFCELYIETFEKALFEGIGRSLINRGNLLSDVDYDSIYYDPLTVLEDYGCHCQFKNFPSKGYGAPQSEIDNLCKMLQDGYTCLKLDASCDPTEISYSSTDCKAHIVLEESNLNDCKRNTCKVEYNFLHAIFNVIKRGYFLGKDAPNMNQLNVKNGFNRTESCISKPNVDVKNKCCGNYPTETMECKRNCYVKNNKGWIISKMNRLPYSDNFASCCDGKIMDIGNC